MFLYSDGSQDEGGRVGRGWYSPGFGGGSDYVGTCVVVWDGVVLGMRIGLDKAP